MLDAAATHTARADRVALALSAGAAKARAGFTDTLDALAAELHGRARDQVGREDAAGALATTLAVDAVDRARTLAGGNVNPQLITATLLEELATVLHG